MTNRPWITLKLATSLDGRIATASGESRWITGEPARMQVHRMRAEHDAVLVGAQTAIRDDPELTVRYHGYEGRQPMRVVLDTHQRTPLTSKMATSAREVPVMLFTGIMPSQALIDAGVDVRQVAATETGLSLDEVLPALAAAGVARLFVEGGGRVAASLIRAGYIDRVEWFRAPIMLGGEGKAAIGDLQVNGLAQAVHLKRIGVQEVGDDLWERYERS
jgi:diaminohydroxyphosphoribosylaminopyrimidine deaminase / 5-amino-6-(5-phosphoribosylamino)uracil reductase